jgi:hypothetical protein
VSGGSYGIQNSGSPVRGAIWRNPGARTPMIWWGRPLMVMVRPITSGAPP